MADKRKRNPEGAGRGNGEEFDETRRRRDDMGLMQWFSGYPDVFRRYSSEMDRMFGDWGLRGPGSLRWPAIEMFDRENEMVIRVELPGIQPDDVHVRQVGDDIVIEGERRTEREQDRRGTRRSEWSYGRFSRQIPLPSDLDAEDLSARMHDGILEIMVPYKEGHRSREIPIERNRGADTTGMDAV
jgi:HSP20 family protein